MKDQIDISICIPAYKQKEFLIRLLDSIAIQTFSNYEIVITDDSPDDSVQELCKQYQQLPLRYYHNRPALGSPANWNSAIRQATGRWIKIMHDDDWFASDDSLEKFARAAQNARDASFVFSGVYYVNIETGKKNAYIPGARAINMLRRSLLYLFKNNIIGHPSTTLIKNNTTEWYDEKLKWVVDFEFYIRYLLLHKKFMLIPEPLVNIGISEYQITKEAFRNPVVEIAESLYLYYKLPPNSLSNLIVYDYYWRLWRNLGIRNEEDVKQYAGDNDFPAVLKHMLNHQSKFPQRLLKIGVISKTGMFVSYLMNYARL